MLEDITCGRQSFVLFLHNEFNLGIKDFESTRKSVPRTKQDVFSFFCDCFARAKKFFLYLTKRVWSHCEHLILTCF